jgi:hypothetical protein
MSSLFGPYQRSITLRWIGKQEHWIYSETQAPTSTMSGIFPTNQMKTPKTDIMEELIASIVSTLFQKAFDVF